MNEQHLVSKKWRDEFILALRTSDVPGDVIGAQLELVEAHCADSGQDAELAFGEPRAYAASLPLQGRGDPWAMRDLSRELASPMSLALLGMLVTLAGTNSLLSGAPPVLTWTLPAVVIGSVLGAVALVVWVPRLGVDWGLGSRRWLAAAAVTGAAVIGGGVAASQWVIATVGVPAAIVGAAGVAMMGGALGWSHSRLGEVAGDVDPVRRPGEDPPAPSLLERNAHLLPVAMVAVGTALIVAFTVLMERVIA